MNESSFRVKGTIVASDRTFVLQTILACFFAVLCNTLSAFVEKWTVFCCFFTNYHADLGKECISQIVFVLYQVWR